jgi:drug/metabolite transporter (DMT)-like permease
MNTAFQANKQTGVLLAFTSLFLLGMLPVISNGRPAGLNALNFAFYLSFWQLVCSLPLLFNEYRKNTHGVFTKQLPVSLRNRTILIILSTGLIFGLSTYVYVFSVEKAGTVSAIIAIQAYPLFAIMWESIFFHKKKTKAELLFTFLLVAGLYYLGTQGSWKIEGLSVWFLLALAVPFLWSIAHVIIKNTLDTTPITPLQVTFFRVFISAIFLLIASISVNGLDTVINGMNVINFQISAFSMGFIYYLELISWFYAVKHIDVSLASSITTPTPLITMLLAVLFLQETIQSFQVTSLLLVIISLYGILYQAKKKQLNT